MALQASENRMTISGQDARIHRKIAQPTRSGVDTDEMGSAARTAALDQRVKRILIGSSPVHAGWAVACTCGQADRGIAISHGFQVPRVQQLTEVEI